MGLTTKTVSCALTEAIFLRKELTDKGDRTVFYFQGPEYTPKSNRKTSPEAVLSGLEELELRKYTGTHKFTIPNDLLLLKRYDLLRDLVGGEKVRLEFGFSPEYFDKADVSYASMSIISLKLISPSNGFPSPPPAAIATAGGNK